MSDKDVDPILGEEQRGDYEISPEEALQVLGLEPIRLDPKNKRDTVDANKDDPPPVPKKVAGSGTTQPTARQTGGDLLQSVFAGLGDQEISIHDLSDKEPASSSASVRAFFQDTVDANYDAPSFSYDMNNKHRGCFIIFNHMNFKKHLQMNPRNGTNRDKKNLERVAKRLGFESVRSFDDLEHSKILEVVHKVAMGDHSQYDCFAMAILTHGDEGDIVYAYDKTFPIDELTEPFMANNCKTLAGKPKLFFVQACRGTKLDSGSTVKIDGRVKVQQVASKTDKEVKVIPNAADFLIAYSTVPGYYAWRNQSEGSWFIQALCKCLDEFGDKMEIMQIMTRVNRMVAYDFISYSKQNLYFHGKKQIPSIVTRLTSEVFFKKKNPVTLPLPSGHKRKPEVGIPRVDGKKETSFQDTFADDLKETNL